MDARVFDKNKSLGRCESQDLTAAPHLVSFWGVGSLSNLDKVKFGLPGLAGRVDEMRVHAEI